MTNLKLLTDQLGQILDTLTQEERNDLWFRMQAKFASYDVDQTIRSVVPSYTDPCLGIPYEQES